MKDLEQLEKKNQNMQANKGSNSNPIKRKFGSPAPSTGEKRPGINYEDKIRELEAKLFGK